MEIIAIVKANEICIIQYLESIIDVCPSNDYSNLMVKIAVKLDDQPAGSPCERCGSGTRLFGIEPHPTVVRTDLLTFVCTQCDAVQTEIVLRRR